MELLLILKKLPAALMSSSVTYKLATTSLEVIASVLHAAGLQALKQKNWTGKKRSGGFIQYIPLSQTLAAGQTTKVSAPTNHPLSQTR